MVSRSHRLQRALVALITAAALVAMPLATSAHGGGSRAAFTATALTTKVSISQPVAFELYVKSDGSDAFDKVRIEAKASGGTLVSAPSGCTASGASVSCSLGKLKSGQALTLRFVFTAPASSGTLTFNASLKGSESKGGHGWNGKHGRHKVTSKDAMKATASASVINDPSFFGTWQQPHATNVTFATAGLGGGNSQSTSVTVPPIGFGYPASVAETNAPVMCKGKNIGGFGQAVDLSIANGTTVTPWLTVTIKYDKSAIGYRDASKIRFVHQTDSGTCEYPVRGCGKHTHGFCYDASWTHTSSGKQLVIRVELPSNGRGKAF